MSGGPYWDEAWNPVTGCTPASPGCEHCWAAAMAHRFHRDFTPTFHADRLNPSFLRARKGKTVFVGNSGDLFHEAITHDQIGEVYGVFDRDGAQGHRFLLLTKRVKRMVYVERWLGESEDAPPIGWWPLRDVWRGVTICDDSESWKAQALVEGTPGVPHWLSLEPLLGPLPSLDLAGIDWVVLGGENGAGARPFWTSDGVDLYRQCKAAGVPFWFKGGGARCSTIRTDMMDDWVEMLGARELPSVAS